MNSAVREAMVFGGDDEEEICERCSTWDEAVRQHARIVNQIRTRLRKDNPRSRPELPACAAIRLFGGLIVAGKRHADCLDSMRAARLDWRKSVEGFMTTKGRFVDRWSARILMEQAGLSSFGPGGFRGQELYSEDLY